LAAGEGVGRIGFELNAVAAGCGIGGIIGLAALLVDGASMASINCARLDAAAGGAGAGVGAGGVVSFEPMITSKLGADATGGGTAGVNGAGAGVFSVSNICVNPPPPTFAGGGAGAVGTLGAEKIGAAAGGV
jgi:hypothetical protein